MRISDWSSDVCSSDLVFESPVVGQLSRCASAAARARQRGTRAQLHRHHNRSTSFPPRDAQRRRLRLRNFSRPRPAPRSRSTGRSEEHTSELQSLMRISYAVFCLKKKSHKLTNTTYHYTTTNHSTRLR